MAFNVSQGIGNITSGPVYVLQENILEKLRLTRGDKMTEKMEQAERLKSCKNRPDG